MKKVWVITVKNNSGKIKTVTVPGGLCESEAVRYACSKYAGYSRLLKNAEFTEISK